MPALAARRSLSMCPDDLLVVAQPLRESAIQAILSNAKAGAVRGRNLRSGILAGGYPVTPARLAVAATSIRARECATAVLYSTLAPFGSF